MSMRCRSSMSISSGLASSLVPALAGSATLGAVIQPCDVYS